MAASFLSIQPIFPLSRSFGPTTKAKMPLAVLDRAQKMRVPYSLKKRQSRLFHDLPSGLNMEVIFQKGLGKGSDEVKDSSRKPPLVFIHGSFHAAWCWAEHWLPFFSEIGYDCYSISLLGQGESDDPPGPAAGTLQTHATDVADFIKEEVGVPPVLIGHSFGGLIIQSYISNMASGLLANKPSSYERNDTHPTFSGAVLVCSVPPSGNSGLVWRYLLTKPVAAFKVTFSLAAKAFATSLALCKETFFSAEMEDQLVQRYQELMKESSRMPLFDLKKLNSSLPPPPVPRDFTEVLVLGASDDFIVVGIGWILNIFKLISLLIRHNKRSTIIGDLVDVEGLKETAEFYGVEPVCIDGVAHDMMLDKSWEKGARAILSWLNDLDAQERQ